MTDALEDRVRAVSPGQLAHLRDALIAALGDDVSGTELAAQIRTDLVPPHQDDPLGTQPLAASTASRPTAPSPITVTDVRASTPAVTAAW